MKPAYAVVVDLYAKTRAIVTVDVVKAIQADAYAAGAADMRERARAECKDLLGVEAWATDSDVTPEVAAAWNKACECCARGIEALPLTAPSAGAPVDESRAELIERPPGCKCHWEEGDSPCPVHEAPPYYAIRARAADMPHDGELICQATCGLSKSCVLRREHGGSHCSRTGTEWPADDTGQKERG